MNHISTVLLVTTFCGGIPMEEKLEILLIEDDPEACRDLTEQILDTEDMILIGVTNNAYKALDLIKDHLPDAIILDLELHLGTGNGLYVLQELQMLSLAKAPYILVTTNNSSTTTYELARKLGADFIMSKHQEGYSNKGVLDFLRITRPVIINAHRKTASEPTTEETIEQQNRRLRRRISTELDYVGINPKSIGYNYLIDAIIIMMKQPTQNLCTIIAQQYGKSEPSIERAMQNAINRAWKMSNINDLLDHYTAKINSAKGSPTITEFICYYANKLRNEY